VFPAYIAHQTVIIVVEYWLRPAHLPGWAEFAILVPATVAGAALFYLAARYVPGLRRFAGLRVGVSPRKRLLTA
jgi:glucan biosynthesis protein C